MYLLFGFHNKNPRKKKKLEKEAGQLLTIQKQ